MKTIPSDLVLPTFDASVEHADLLTIRALLLKAAELADKVHTNAGTLVEHNLSIDLEEAIRKGLPLLAGIKTNRDYAELNRLQDWDRAGNATQAHRERATVLQRRLLPS